MTRRWWLGVAVVVGVLAVAAASGGPGAVGAPLDPDSTAPDGARALVETLDRLGVDVGAVSGEPSAAAGRALVLADPGLDADVVGRWVDAGGVLVVADPGSPLHPGWRRTGQRVAGLQARCAIGALDGLALEARVALSVPPDGATACFRSSEGGAWLVAVGSGAGVVVGLADPEPLVNRSLADGDHAAVAVALLGGGGPVEVVRPTRPGEGQQGLADLVPAGVRWGLAQALVAAVLFALVQGRRLGRPLVDRPPVEVPAASLVAAVAGLRSRAGARQASADRIAAWGRARVGRALGLGPADVGVPVRSAGSPAVGDPGPGAMEEAVAAATGLPAGQVVEVLAPPPPADDQALVDAARSIHRMVRDVEESRHGRTASG